MPMFAITVMVARNPKHPDAVLEQWRQDDLDWLLEIAVAQDDDGVARF